MQEDDFQEIGALVAVKRNGRYRLLPFAKISLYSIVMQVVQGKTDLQGFQSGCGEDCPG